ncbi:MAG: Gfo/Idh/MocA family oxidoreductase [Galbitalea sp.]
MPDASGTIRIGILGAAGIAPEAVIDPARSVDEVEIVAVAARDRARGAAFAAEHGIPRVHERYEDLLADPEVDVVYNPTPNGLHGRWTVAAVAAGKHVLCEKPFTANAAEAREVAAVIADSDRIVIEAFHYRYHPLMTRALEIVGSGELGRLVSIEGGFGGMGRPKDDIRWSLPLAGGALMDVGCYPVHLVRTLAGAEPTVTAARAVVAETGVDGEMEIELRFPEGLSGKVRTSMQSPTPYVYATVVGEDAVLEIENAFIPMRGNSLTVRGAGGTRRETVTTEPSYVFQLRSLADVLLRGAPVLTPPADSIANMEVIDAAYRAAGIAPREPTR